MLVPVNMASVEEHMPTLLLHLRRNLGKPVNWTLHLAKLVLLVLGLVVGSTIKLGSSVPHCWLIRKLGKGLFLHWVSGKLLLVSGLPIELWALLSLVRLKIWLLLLNFMGHIIVLVACLALKLAFI